MRPDRLLPVERLAAGRHRDVVVDRDLVAHPRIRRAFTWVLALLVVETVISLGAVGYAVWLTEHGREPAWPVWMRSLVVLAMTLSLFWFAWRARQGWYWAWQRLKLFTRIFPIVTLVIAAIPGLYPGWMVAEQIVFSVLLIGVGDFLTSDAMRDTFRLPAA